MASVLVIDDDRVLCGMAADAARQLGLNAEISPTGRHGVELFMTLRPQVVIVETSLADRSGLSVLEELTHKDPKTPVIVTATRGGGPLAIEAMRLGAFDFMFKPLEAVQLSAALQRALHAIWQSQPALEVRDTAELSGGGGDALLGRSAAMQEVYKSVGLVAWQEIPVLIQGSPGSGKQTLARTIHDFSRHAQEPFTVVRCSSQSRLDAERRAGQNGSPANAPATLPATGTLLLADVERLTLEAQYDLLERLSRQPETAVGSGLGIAGPRLLASSTVDLQASVAKGGLLPELFYALSCFCIRLPTLSQRIEDIAVLAEHFLRQWSRRLGKRVYQLSPPAREALEAHDWPGNLRELDSVICQAAVRAKGSVLLVDHLPDAFRGLPDAKSEATRLDVQVDWRRFVQEHLTSAGDALYEHALAAMEMPLLRLVLANTEGNQARAAKILGMTRGRLRQKLRERGIVIDRSVAVHREEERLASNPMCDPADVM